jgi:hypothetical protein
VKIHKVVAVVELVVLVQLELVLYPLEFQTVGLVELV